MGQAGLGGGTGRDKADSCEPGWDFPKGGSVLQNSFVCGQLKLNLYWLKKKGCFSGSCDRKGQGL